MENVSSPLDHQSIDPAETPYEPAATPEPAAGTNTMAIVGLILAFLIPPIGLILSIVALVQLRKNRQAGRGMAIGGLIVSALFTLLGVVLLVTTLLAVGKVVGKNAETLVDPGCSAGREALTQFEAASQPADAAALEAQLQKGIDDMRAAAAKSEHDNVRAAMNAVADDFDQLLQAVKKGEQPPAELETKINSDGDKFDELCSLGGAQK
jgi:hypothetical protein